MCQFPNTVDSTVLLHVAELNANPWHIVVTDETPQMTALRTWEANQ